MYLQLIMLEIGLCDVTKGVLFKSTCWNMVIPIKGARKNGSRCNIAFNVWIKGIKPVFVQVTNKSNWIMWSNEIHFIGLQLLNLLFRVKRVKKYTYRSKIVFKVAIKWKNTFWCKLQKKAFEFCEVMKSISFDSTCWNLMIRVKRVRKTPIKVKLYSNWKKHVIVQVVAISNKLFKVKKTVSFNPNCRKKFGSCQRCQKWL